MDAEPKDLAGRVTQAELARRLKVTRGAVSKAVKSGRITPDEDGLFDPAEAELQWIANSRPNVKATQSPAAKSRASGYADARARKENALASMAELRLAQAAGTLMEKSDVDFILADTGATLRALMENLPDRLAPLIVGLRDMEAIHAAISEAADHVLSELSAHCARRAAELRRGEEAS
ncbi:MAG: hypothetical protein M0Z73_13350 [Betaproteobacteria bacterium]|nr:hypothetical protein [Betaproteobacteria bacterium]